MRREDVAPFLPVLRGLRRFAAWFCRDDDPLHAAMGVRLERARTLADGDDHCDFRLSFCGKSFTQVMEQPPRFA